MLNVPGSKLPNFSTPDLSQAQFDISTEPASSTTRLIPPRSEDPKMAVRKGAGSRIRKMLSTTDLAQSTTDPGSSTMARRLNQAVNVMSQRKGELAARDKRRIRRDVFGTMAVNEMIDKNEAQMKYAATSACNRQLPQNSRQSEEALYRSAVLGSTHERTIGRSSYFTVLKRMRYQKGAGNIASTAGAVLDLGKLPLLHVIRRFTPDAVLHRQEVERRRNQMQTQGSQTLGQRNANRKALASELANLETALTTSSILFEEDESNADDRMSQAGAAVIEHLSPVHRGHLRRISQRLTNEDVQAVWEAMLPEEKEALNEYSHRLSVSLEGMPADTGVAPGGQDSRR